MEMQHYMEREYTSKAGFNCLDSSVYGKCRIISKEEIKEELEENECLVKCETINNSSFNFYLDEEIVKIYAVKKN